MNTKGTRMLLSEILRIVSNFAKMQEKETTNFLARLARDVASREMSYEDSIVIDQCSIAATRGKTHAEVRLSTKSTLQKEGFRIGPALDRDHSKFMTVYW